MIDYNAIASKVMGKLQKSDYSENKDFLKTETGSSVLGRWLPNIKDIDNTIYLYYWHSWISTNGSGKKLYFLCPNTYGERCPICSRSVAMWKSNDETLKALSKKISRRKNFMVNFYVISDNKNSENNDKVKILRYGKQIEDIYLQATNEENKAIFGERIWRLDEQGCNFRVKAMPNSDAKDAWPTYTMSQFLPPSRIEGMTEEKAQSILNGAFDLTKQNQVTSYKDLDNALEEHFSIGMSTASIPSSRGGTTVSIPPAKPQEAPKVVVQAPAPSAPAPATTQVNEAVPATATLTPPPTTPAETQMSDIDAMLQELQNNPKA